MMQPAAITTRVAIEGAVVNGERAAIAIDSAADIAAIIV
jgi:hypothetical protein